VAVGDTTGISVGDAIGVSVGVAAGAAVGKATGVSVKDMIGVSAGGGTGVSVAGGCAVSNEDGRQPKMPNSPKAQHKVRANRRLDIFDILYPLPDNRNRRAQDAEHNPVDVFNVSLLASVPWVHTIRRAKAPAGCF
jgi:hypothetical protein